MLIRDFPFTMRAAEDTILVTCAAIMTTAGSTAATGMLSNKTTASAVVSTGTLGALSTAQGGAFNAGMATLNGRIIDRLRFPMGAGYYGAVVSASLNSTRGSTEANRKLGVGVKLQHGDSSGGGDLADYSTAFQPSDRQYFSSGRSTDHAAWDATESTGSVYAVSNPGYYDLRGAKRYLRVVGRFGKDAVTTESSADEQARVAMDITFVAGDRLPQRGDTTGPYSTSTST